MLYYIILYYVMAFQTYNFFQQIDYSITGGQSNGEFKVLTENISVSNAVSFIAEIMVGKPLDREKRDRFNLTVLLAM